MVGSGVNALLYVSLCNSAPDNTITVYNTSNGLTFGLLENTGILGARVVIAREPNTGGDGDVLWAQNAHTLGDGRTPLYRYVRSAGVWTQDSAFTVGVSEAVFHQGDYVNILGKDVLILPSNVYTQPKIYALDGDTGAKLAEITITGFGPAPTDYSKMAGLEVYQETPGSDTCKVYFGMGYNHAYGRLTFSVSTTVAVFDSWGLYE